jgi:LAO/AO transport system kinase
MDAMGKDIVIVETVGVGQAETDIAGITDTCIIVLTPGMGDEIQLMKAGILEIADIFVINKADNNGADNLKIDLESMINLHEFRPGQWKPQVILTTAVSNMGIDTLSTKISEHREFLNSSGEIKRRARERVKLELMNTVEHLLDVHIRKHIGKSDDRDEVINNIMRREIDPYSAARAIVARCTNGLM